MKKSLDFSFGVLALKLLGKNLYSNPITAISELVANGLDANGNEIKVFIDIRNKEKSIIEIYDNGIGMSLEDIETKYCEIGYKKRIDQSLEKEIDPKKVMGRKGIGKLAALYLSNLYYVISKKKNFDINCYKVDLRNYNDDISISERAQMHLFDYDKLELDNHIKNEILTQGTIIRIEEINLKGFGEVGLEALSWKLANYFSLENLGSKSIKLKIIQKDEDLKNNYQKVTKNIAFKNMYMLTSSYDEKSDFFVENIEKLNSKIEFKPQKLQKLQYNHQDFEVERKSSDFKSKGTISYNNINYSYELKGWVGIHSSIRGDNFIETNGNEDRVYNKFYNPCQLRLYIRNKLAVENLLPKLKNTQAFANYIEGEIFFDLLDDNDLPDITTSNRQDIDENDIRVSTLLTLLKGIINNLIAARLKIAGYIREKEEEILGNIATNNKTKLIKIAKKNKFSKEVIEFLHEKVKGNFLKDTARIFISYSKENREIVNFVYNVLLYLGVMDDEIFYTSKTGQYFSEKEKENIIKAMKENIEDKETLMLYFVTPSFLNRRFTLFEAGAGWVTKAKNQYIILTNDADKVKTDLEILYTNNWLYLYSNKESFKTWSEQNMKDNIEYYNNNIVPLFNKCIDHLNNKRKIKNISLIQKLNCINEWKEADSKIIELWNDHFNEENYKNFVSLNEKLNQFEN